ncbi:hypothetical protein ABPG72_006736 [Tetrahymena utriculariae]
MEQIEKIKPKYMVALWNAIKSTYVALKNYYTADKSTQEKKEQETSIYNNEIQKINEYLKLAFSKKFLLENAENKMNLQGLNYTKEELEEIFRNERNLFHPDKYTSQAQKRALGKTFAQIAESYEIIKLLKNWN